MAWPRRAPSRATVVVIANLVVGLSPADLPAQERSAPPAVGEILLERTLAIVGGAVVTQSDVALAQALGLVDQPAAATPETALGALVDRWLMLHEVARFAPAEPAAAAIAARLAAVRTRAGGESVAAQLTAAGRSTSYLAAWVRDDLRIEAYLNQRFASTGAPAESDVAVYAQAHAGELAQAGFSGPDVSRAARERLLQERRRELIADWLADLRRRTNVVTFPAGAR